MREQAKQEKSICSEFQSRVNSLLSVPEPGRNREGILRIGKEVHRNMAMSNPGSAELDACISLFREAADPSAFHTERITDPHSELFDQYFSVMSDSFDADVLEDREVYIRSMVGPGADSDESPDIIIVRYFEADGRQKYDFSGNLAEFDCTDKGKTRRVVCFISGTYMPFLGKHANRSVCGLGHMKTLDSFLGMGHGRTVLDAMRDIAREYAAKRGHDLLGMSGEVQNSSAGFFFRYGFRWPEGVYYSQPPLKFDRETGRKRFHEVPEHLMVFMNSGAEQIGKGELIEMVRAIYHHWMIKPHEEDPGMVPAAVENIKGYVWGKVFREFVESVNAVPGGLCRMTAPLNSTILRLDAANGMILRRITAQDSEAIMTHLPDMFDPRSAPEVQDAIRRHAQGIRDPLLTTEMYVVTDLGNGIIGISGLYSVDASTAPLGANEQGRAVARLGWFGIRPEFRGMGKGRVLLRMTAEYAEMIGAGMLCIETSSNPMYDAARRLYESEGFRTSEKIPGYFGPRRPLVHCFGRVRDLVFPGGDVYVKCALAAGHPEELEGMRPGRDREDLMRAMKMLETRPAGPDVELRLLRALRGGVCIGIFSMARYLWMANDVCWVRWFLAAREEDRPAVLEAIIREASGSDIRMLVFEASGSGDVDLLKGMGLVTGESIPELYIPREDWPTVLRKELDAGLITKEQFENAKGRQLQFYLYWKKIS